MHPYLVPQIDFSDAEEQHSAEYYSRQKIYVETFLGTVHMNYGKKSDRNTSNPNVNLPTTLAACLWQMRIEHTVPVYIGISDITGY